MTKLDWHEDFEVRIDSPTTAILQIHVWEGVSGYPHLFGRALIKILDLEPRSFESRKVIIEDCNSHAGLGRKERPVLDLDIRLRFEPYQRKQK